MSASGWLNLHVSSSRYRVSASGWLNLHVPVAGTECLLLDG